MRLSFPWTFLGILMMVFSLSRIPAHAKDVYVGGYYRRNGTYVRPYVRSSPDGYRWNNYGPSTDSSQLLNPQSRDADRDGIPSYLDHDDDNDGIADDNDSSQYSP